MTLSEHLLFSTMKPLFSVKDVRPGLVFKQSTKRQFQLEEQHRSANEKMRKLNKPVKVLEAEKREEGLSTAITSQNKGI